MIHALNNPLRLVASRVDKSAMKGRAEALERLKSLPVSVAILDVSGTIIAVNQAWKDFGRKNGLRISNYGIGTSYLGYCGTDSARSDGMVEQIRGLIAGRLDLLTVVYPCDSETESNWIVLIGVPLSTDRPTGVALLHVNFTQMISVQRTAGSIGTGMARAAGAPLANGAAAVSGSVESSVADSLSSELMAMFRGRPRAPRHAAGVHGQAVVAPARLSKRQLQVLQLLGEGKTNAQIARQLFRSPNTIKLHVSAILKRLALKSRTQAALLASTLDWPPSAPN
jgi:DNA-binding CsgD family transcriptional regulator